MNLFWCLLLALLLSLVTVSGEKLKPSENPKCKQKCSKEEDKVCGSDGTTYRNMCILEMIQCQMDEDLMKMGDGDCWDLPLEKLPPHLRAKKERCFKECPDKREPICTTKGRTFHNECEMQKYACINRSPQEIKYQGVCEMPEEKEEL